jgi:hypothetical protein
MKLSQNSFQDEGLLLAVLNSRFLPPSKFQASVIKCISRTRHQKS